MSIKIKRRKSVAKQQRLHILPDGRMTRKNAARYLGISPKTLACWAVDGKGPAFVKVGGKVFYFQAELDRFIAAGSNQNP